MEITTKSADETKAAGYKFGGTLKRGDVILLYGDLGSGKTTFVKGVARSLGITEEITSPTFVFCKKYRIDGYLLAHYDCYRVGSEEDAEAIGLKEDLSHPDDILLIEWPENISNLVPNNVKKVEFEYKSENERSIEI